MAGIPLGNNLEYKGKKPNFERDQFATLAEMKAFNENYLPDVFYSVCLETKKRYKFDRENDIDPITGKWREDSGTGGSSGNDYTDADKAKVGKIGQFADLTIADVETIVGALNKLHAADAKSVELDSDKKLKFKDKDGGVLFEQDMSGLIPETNLEDLKNTAIVDVENKQMLRYDTASGKWVNFTDDTLDTAKSYTDQEIAKLTINKGKIVSEKPLATDPDLVVGDWYYYTVDDVAYQTIYLPNNSNELVELTMRVSTIDLSDYVSFTLNVASTYEETPTDTAKIPDIAWVMGLKEALLEKIGEKLNKSDVADNLTTDDPEKALSAKQGKVLNEKIEALEESGAAFDEEGGTMAACGGLAKGTVIKDKTVKETLQMILFPYTKPSVFLSITPNTLLYKKGVSVAGVSLSAAVTKNSEAVTAVAFEKDGTTLETITSDVANGGTFTHNLAAALTADTVLKATATDGTETAEASVSVEFVDPVYYGIEGEALSEKIMKKGTFTYSNINCTNGKVVVKIPASWSVMSGGILDANSFQVKDSFSTELEDIGGTAYAVYKMKTAATLQNFSFKFVY